MKNFLIGHFIRYVLSIAVVSSVLGFPQVGLAQSNLSIRDSVEASQFTLKGNSFIKLNKYDSALINYKKAAIIYKNAADWNSFFYTQFQIGYYLNVQRKYVENVNYLDSIESHYGKHLAPKDKSFQRFYGVKSWAHFKLIQLAKSLHYFALLEDAAKKNNEVSVNDYLYAVFYKGIVYQRIGQYDLALKQMNLAKEICDNQGACDFLGNTYNNLGIIYRNLNEYERSAEFYKKALAILRKNGNEVSLTPIFNNIGKVYLFQKKYEEALKELNYALKVLTDYTTDYYQVESALINTKSNVLIKMKRFTEAENILKKVYDREVEKYEEIGANSSETLFSLGKLYAESGKFELSSTYLNLSISVTERFLGKKNDKSAAMYNLKGKNLLNTQKYVKAAEVFQLSIISLVTDFNNPDIYNNPSLTDEILDRVELVEALYQKGEALLALYRNKANYEYIKGALEANKTAAKLVEQVRNNMLYEGSIIRISEEAKSIYEQSIKIALLKNSDNKSIIFNAIENSKSHTLAGAVQRAKSLGYSGQDNAALQKEANFKTSIKILESELRSAILSEKGNVEILNLKEELFAVKEEFEAYEAKSSKLLTHTKGMKVPSLEIVQSKLEQGDLLIDYFAGESTLYAIAISPNSVEIYELQDCIQTINMFRKSISQGIQPQEFEQIAYQTYQLILAPILTDFSSATRLIIIPDQQLGNIPFDALVSEHNEGVSFKKLSYLLNSYTIFQHQSASLYVASYLENNTKGYIGFAPDFSRKELNQLENRNLRGDLQPLPFAKAEVEQIAKLLHGSIETGSNASEVKFKSITSGYSILHIASHAIIDNERPLYSKLVFSNREDSTHQEDGNLYSFEIYGLKLNSDLVTLSACNTGNGKFYEGEGIFSLGRAFLVAGANSVLTSLWEVSDQSTVQIMTSFYKRLKKGANKPEALRQAKLAYLKNADGLTANPYYWAGFVYTGKPDTVYKNFKLYYWIGGIVFLLLITFFYLQKTNKKLLNLRS